MSLKTALKVGLGTSDESNSRHNRGGVTETPELIISKPSLMHKNKIFNEQKVKQSNLTESLSDSLPTPKLISSPGQHPANLNKKIRIESHANGDFEKVKVSEPEQVDKKSLCERNVNPRQYVVELDRFLSRQNSNLTQDIVLDVSSKEIEQITKLSARVRGRYIAKVLDVGRSEKGGLKESELTELRRCRESCEELSLGITALKEAISDGDITVIGRIKV
jgi:hypothetical protein